MEYAEIFREMIKAMKADPDMSIDEFLEARNVRKCYYRLWVERKFGVLPAEFKRAIRRGRKIKSLKHVDIGDKIELTEYGVAKIRNIAKTPSFLNMYDNLAHVIAASGFICLDNENLVLELTYAPGKPKCMHNLTVVKGYFNPNTDFIEASTISKKVKDYVGVLNVY